MDDSLTTGEPARHRPRVPVDQRWLGIDKRSILPAAVVLAVWLLWTVVVPAINDRVDYDDVVRPGETFALGDELAFTPAPGWNVVDGFRLDDLPVTGPSGVTLSNGQITLIARTDTFDGTPTELLDQINAVDVGLLGKETFRSTHERTTVTTDSGLTGVAEGFVTPRSQGVVAAFVVDGTGVEVQVVGSSDAMSGASDTIADMVESIHVVTEDAA